MDAAAADPVPGVSSDTADTLRFFSFCSTCEKLKALGKEKQVRMREMGLQHEE